MLVLLAPEVEKKLKANPNNLPTKTVGNPGFLRGGQMPTGAESSLRDFQESQTPNPREIWALRQLQKTNSMAGAEVAKVRQRLWLHCAGLQFRILVSWPIPVTSSYLGRPGLQTSSLGQHAR